MRHSDFNSSSTHSTYYYEECDENGVDQSGGMMTGLLILFSCYILETLLGAPPNFWLLHHILKNRSKAGGILPADFLPLQLVLAQLIFFLTPPMCIMNHFLWRSGPMMDLVTVLNSTVLIMKPLILALVCVEWYMAVVRPLDYTRITKRHYRWVCVVAIWVIYIVIMVEATHNRNVYLVSLVQLPVLLVATFCSASILRALRKPAPNEKLREQREMNSMKRKAFVTVAIIQTILTLNYMPFVLLMPLSCFVESLTVKCLWVPLALAGASSCSYLQPLLYLLRLGQLPCTCRT